ncbi:MAG: AAA family ATPase [Bacteroidales bacterium]
MQNPELDLAFDFVQYTNRNIFLTGKAGTGKTTFLHKLKKISPKRMVVVAPTGVAAINAGGVTIHSFFQMPFGPILPDRLDENSNTTEKNRFLQKFNKKKINIIRSIDLLVIDEISMVRADLLDGIDTVLRRYKNRNQVFGGVQLLMIGDLQQLAPVVKENEWNLLRGYYETVFFFSSNSFKLSNPVSIELKHIYRQQDNKFIKILNEIREDKLSEASLVELQKRYIPNYSPQKEEGYITLTTHNASANRINEEQLKKVKAKIHSFEAEVRGQFPEHSYPADEKLKLKVGAQVMFIKNDSSPEKRFYNGKIGVVTDIEDDMIFVKCKDEDEVIGVEQAIWENVKYTINERTKEIEEEVAGSFIQYPLRLAWAITIHKSQGLTFGKAIIDAQAAFAHGQTYVALSRCKTLEGLILSTPVTNDGIICDRTVSSFNQHVEENQPDEKVLLNSKHSYYLNLLDELFSFRQVQYHIDKCKKLIDENGSVIQGNLSEMLKDMLEKGTRVLNEVAGKFIIQLKQLSAEDLTIETNEQLQERIKKGSIYFLQQMDLRYPDATGSKTSFETDNKAVRKPINETLLKIRELLAVKQACLLGCKSGFTSTHYLKTRALALLETPDIKMERKKEDIYTASNHPVLYDRLKTWRNAVAKKTGQPHFMIAHQKLLIGISNELPGNEKQLKAIKGMGKKKLETHGKELLKIIWEYCEENELAPSDKVIVEKIKPPRSDTKEVSRELFRQGNTIQQIAMLRGMVASTIERHLSYFVETGELRLQQFMDARTSKLIMDYLLSNPGKSSSEVKEALDDTISYSDLRFVRAHLTFLSSLED